MTTPLIGMLLALVPLTQDQAVPVEQAHTPGETLVTRLQVSQELLLESLIRQREGASPAPIAAAGVLSTELFAEWRDDFVAEEGNDPAVRRSWRKIELTGKSAFTPAGTRTISESTRFGSHFQGRTIYCQWIPEEAHYARRYEYLDGPEEPLGRIREEADGRSALPPGPVRPGDRWELDSEAVHRLLTPGGDLDLVAVKKAQTSRTMKLGVAGPLADTLAGDLFGRADVTFREVRTLDDGTEIAVLAIENLEMQSFGDQTERYWAMLDDRDAAEPALLEGVVLDYRLDGRGELLWNLARQRLHQLVIEGEQRAGIAMTKQFAEVEETYRLTETAAYRGSLKLTLTAEPPE